MRPGKPILLLLCALGLALPGGAAAAAAPKGSGEPFFPHAGDRGYDALHYGVRLAFMPSSGKIEAEARIAAVARGRLAELGLDLDGLRVSSVSVDGERASWRRGDDKLLVEPRTPPLKGERFLVRVRYHGRPHKVIDPDGSAEGWYPTADGALAVGEPQGTAAWLPCDNVPADKASFDLHLTVPAGLEAVSNGRLTGTVRDSGDRLTYNWSEPSPMSTYLAVVSIGRGKLVHQQIAGHPGWTIVAPELAARSRKALSRLPEIIHFESSIYGPYPFEAAGSIVADAPDLGYALETQSRPIYAFTPDLTTVVHETAHQWFGDSVGLKRWPQIWLNEGFATWTEWYYAERHGGRSAAAIFHRLYRRVPASKTDFWNPPTGHPGSPKHLFGPSVYIRGAMTLEALREKIGSKPMLKTLRTWATNYRHASGDTGEFVALAEEVSGQDLGAFFHRWLYKRGKP